MDVNVLRLRRLHLSPDAEPNVVYRLGRDPGADDTRLSRCARFQRLDKSRTTFVQYLCPAPLTDHIFIHHKHPEAEISDEMTVGERRLILRAIPWCLSERALAQDVVATSTPTSVSSVSSMSETRQWPIEACRPALINNGDLQLFRDVKRYRTTISTIDAEYLMLQRAGRLISSVPNLESLPHRDDAGA